jgi:hypothetical protein
MVVINAYFPVPSSSTFPIFGFFISCTIAIDRDKNLKAADLDMTSLVDTSFFKLGFSLKTIQILVRLSF